jgi:hypothetical protein
MVSSLVISMWSMRLRRGFAFLGGAVGEDLAGVLAYLPQLSRAWCGGWVVEFGVSGAELCGALGQLGEAGLADGGVHGAGLEGAQVAVDGGLGFGEVLLVPASSRRRSAWLSWWAC